MQNIDSNPYQPKGLETIQSPLEEMKFVVTGLLTADLGGKEPQSIKI